MESPKFYAQHLLSLAQTDTPFEHLLESLEQFCHTVAPATEDNLPLYDLKKYLLETKVPYSDLTVNMPEAIAILLADPSHSMQESFARHFYESVKPGGELYIRLKSLAP